MTSSTFLSRARVLALTLSLSAVALTGCDTMSPRERGTAQGAGIGAVAGAVIGSATGGRAGTGAVVGGILGGIGGNLWSQRQEQRQRDMEMATRGTGIQVSRTQDNQLRINVPSDISFDTGSAALRPNLLRVLDQFADSLRNDPYPTVTVVGHTDSTGSDAINEPLSRARADSVRDYLGNRGVNYSRISTEGRGSRQPVASNSNDYGRAQNRRVEIFLREPQR
jgi:outer membrane protein OmpA-like peptidoglycan-associated protein